MSTQEASALEMSSGPLTRRLLRFALPVMFTGILQLLYNAADIVVVGQFGGGHASVAAVGSTGALVNLLVWLLDNPATLADPDLNDKLDALIAENLR